jgi:hypothetical protein
MSIKLTDQEIAEIAEEAMHAAFSLIAERLDPEARHDLGGYYGYHMEPTANHIAAELERATRWGQAHVNGETPNA